MCTTEESHFPSDGVWSAHDSIAAVPSDSREGQSLANSGQLWWRVEQDEFFGSNATPSPGRSTQLKQVGKRINASARHWSNAMRPRCVPPEPRRLHSRRVCTEDIDHWIVAYE